MTVDDKSSTWRNDQHCSHIMRLHCVFLRCTSSSPRRVMQTAVYTFRMKKNMPPRRITSLMNGRMTSGALFRPFCVRINRLIISKVCRSGGRLKAPYRGPYVDLRHPDGPISLYSIGVTWWHNNRRPRLKCVSECVRHAHTHAHTRRRIARHGLSPHRRKCDSISGRWRHL